jgi:hypothetical protein
MKNLARQTAAKTNDPSFKKGVCGRHIHSSDTENIPTAATILAQAQSGLTDLGGQAITKGMSQVANSKPTEFSHCDP